MTQHGSRAPYPGHRVKSTHGVRRAMKFRGLDISVETDVGQFRYWTDERGRTGTTKMQHPYGYIRKTLGADGDHVDVYVGPSQHSDRVFVVHQMKKPKDPSAPWSEYDEDKVMLGFDDADAARRAYAAHYDDPRFFGDMTAMSFADFKNHVLDADNHGEPIRKGAMPNTHPLACPHCGVSAARPGTDRLRFPTSCVVLHKSGAVGVNCHACGNEVLLPVRVLDGAFLLQKGETQETRRFIFRRS